MSKPKIQVGDTFTNSQGCDATVINYKNSRNITIKFNDDYEYEKVVESRYLKRKGFSNPFFRSVQGIGMVGDGEYKTSVKIISPDGKITYKRPKAYIVWSSMIRRCYSEQSLERRPTYENVTVCEQWHNYQNFAEWYGSKALDRIDYHLDKDLLSSKSKVYSPETCCLIPLEINNAISINRSSRDDGFIGAFEMPDREVNKFKSGVSMYGEEKTLGYFETAEEAHQAYVLAKEAHIKELANRWRGHIDERVYDALIKWTVN